MNYQRVYDEIIAKAQARPKPDCYTEKHHIIPKALGGSDTADNLVELTAREHFLCHYCLWKSSDIGTEARHKMAFAFNMMKANPNHNEKRYINSRLYASLKEEGRTHTAEARKKMSLANKGKTLSAEHKKKLSLARKGTTLSTETKKKIGLAQKGKTRSVEHIKKIILSRKGKPNSRVSTLRKSITSIENGLEKGTTKWYRQSPYGRYKVVINFDGKSIYLGTYGTPEEAREAYLPAIKKRLRELKLELESLELKKVA